MINLQTCLDACPAFNSNPTSLCTIFMCRLLCRSSIAAHTPMIATLEERYCLPFLEGRCRRFTSTQLLSKLCSVGAHTRNSELTASHEKFIKVCGSESRRIEGFFLQHICLISALISLWRREITLAWMRGCCRAWRAMAVWLFRVTPLTRDFIADAFVTTWVLAVFPFTTTYSTFTCIQGVNEKFTCTIW